jgi:hypothetical protein
MKLDHEKHFTGYVYINNKYQTLQDKCCLKSIFKRKEEMNQKIKSKLQSSDKGSYYNYLLLGILGIFSAVFFTKLYPLLIDISKFHYRYS